MNFPEDKDQIIHDALNKIYSVFKREGKYVAINITPQPPAPLNINETAFAIERIAETMQAEGLIDENRTITRKGKEIAEGKGGWLKFRSTPKYKLGDILKNIDFFLGIFASLATVGAFVLGYLLYIEKNEAMELNSRIEELLKSNENYSKQVDSVLLLRSDTIPK